MRADGFAPLPPEPNHFSIQNSPNFVVFTNTVPAAAHISPELLPALSRMIRLCNSHQVDCQFVITPIHADVLYGLYLKDDWRELEMLKRRLSEIAPTWDFTRYNSYIDERYGRVVYWPEAFHYSPALGGLMVRRIMGHDTRDLAGNFGVLVDPQNVDAQLSEWTAERQTWTAAHPEVVDRYDDAFANVRKGLSFTEATQALATNFSPVR
jgi:hypothetical protein